MMPHSSTLAWKIPWTEEPGGLQSMGSRPSNFTFTFRFHALEKELATHSNVLAWRIPGMGEPGGLPSMGSHRVGHDRSDLAAWSENGVWSHLTSKDHSLDPWAGPVLGSMVLTRLSQLKVELDTVTWSSWKTTLAKIYCLGSVKFGGCAICHKIIKASLFNESRATSGGIFSKPQDQLKNFCQSLVSDNLVGTISMGARLMGTACGLGCYLGEYSPADLLLILPLPRLPHPHQQSPAYGRSHNKGFVTWDQTSDPSSSVSCLLSLAESWHLSRRQNTGQPPRRANSIAGRRGMKTPGLTPDLCVPQSSTLNEVSGQVRSLTKFQACFAHPSLKGLPASLCQIYRHIWISFLKFQTLGFDIFLSNTFLLWPEKHKEHLHPPSN